MREGHRESSDTALSLTRLGAPQRPALCLIQHERVAAAPVLCDHDRRFKARVNGTAGDRSAILPNVLDVEGDAAAGIVASGAVRARTDRRNRRLGRETPQILDRPLRSRRSPVVRDIQVVSRVGLQARAPVRALIEEPLRGEDRPLAPGRSSPRRIIAFQSAIERVFNASTHRC